MTSATVPPRPGQTRLVYGDPQLHTDGDLVALAYAPDGTLWSVEEPGLVRGWDGATGRQRAWHALSDLETLWCFSADARVLASGSAELSIWDAAAGSLLTALPQPSWVTALAFHPDPTLVATGHDDGVVRFWDATGHRLLGEMRLHQRPVSALAISRDGSRLASAAEDKVVAVWELPSGRLLTTCQGHTDRIPALAWHPHGDTLVSAGWDTTARVWDARTGAPLFLFNSHANQVTGLAFNAQGTLLACADSAPAVHVWDFDTKKNQYILHPNESETACLAFSPDGQRLAVGGAGRIVHLWESRSGQPLSVSSAGSQDRISVTLNPDATRLAANGRAAVRVWDTTTRQTVLELEGPVHALAYSPDGRWLAGGTDTHLCVWDTVTGRRVAAQEGPEEAITAVAFAPDGLTLATAGAAGLEVWLWRVPAWEPILIIPDALDGCTVESLAFHPQGRLLAVGGIDWLATGGSDGAISVWDIVGRHEVATFIGGTTGVAFHPSGQRLAATSLDQSVCIWDLQTQELITELSAHQDRVTCVAYHPSGRWLASAGEDRTIRLWDEAAGTLMGGCELDTLVQVLGFSSDGRWLFTGNGNTTCYQLEVASLLANVPGSRPPAPPPGDLLPVLD